MPSPIRGPQIATGADGIQTANLEDLAVTTAKIAALNVTTAKLAANAVTDAKVDSTVIVASGANAYTGDQPMGANKITGLAPGTAGTDAVNKSQLDSVSAGLDPKGSCVVATDAALPANTASLGPGIGKKLTMDATGIVTIDGRNILAGDRVLIKDEGGGTSIHNGIYDCTIEGDGGTAGEFTRASDLDEDSEMTAAAYTFIEEGAANADTGWLIETNDPITVDVTATTWTQFSGGGSVIAGTGLTQSGSTINAIGGNGITANANDLEVDYESVGNITTVNAGDTASAGVNNTAARGDHEHAVATAAGTAAQVGQGNAEGSATDLARSDHTHSHTRGTPGALGAANVAGTSTDFVGADHIHKRDTDQPESVTTEAISSSDTAMADTLDFDPVFPGAVILTLNGVVQDQGTGEDYTLGGAGNRTITWLASSGTAVNMKASDSMKARYRVQG